MKRKAAILAGILLLALLVGGYLLIKSKTDKSAQMVKQPATTAQQLSNDETAKQDANAEGAAVSTTTQQQLSPENITQIELILDDSGSMAGLAGGKAKIDIAKESINKIIDELKAKNKLQVALRIYGHQNKECTNSVLEMPMDEIQADQMKAKIKDLQPLGYTPIYYSLTESVNDFNKSIPGDKIVVLVTDGLESCGGDPCAAAKALAAGGIINKMQVVGFGLSKTELNTLQCIVDPFKGQVVGANNSTEFLDAMQKIMEKATDQPNLDVSVVGADGKPLQASDICIYPQGQTENEVVCAGMFTSEYEFSLKPATYDVKITNANTKEDSWLKDVELKSSDSIQKTVTFAEGTLKVVIVNASGESVQASDICVYPQGQTENEVDCAGTFASESEFKLNPGVYDVKASTYDNTGEKWSKNIEIKASQIVTQKITL